MDATEMYIAECEVEYERRTRPRVAPLWQVAALCGLWLLAGFILAHLF